jgi:arginine/lysine/ornithine decarboxylase
MSDIAAISREAKKYGVPVLADNAHGAHLKFIDNSLSPITRGAAMSADSAHKTLPVLTGGAWLNITDEKYLPGARAALALFGSTSPSYLTMLSLDLCRVWLAENGSEELKKLAVKVSELKEYARKLGLVLPQGECDPLRIAFNTESGRFGGEKAGELLRNNQIEPEYAGRDGVIFIPSPFNIEKDFDRLRLALLELSKLIKHGGHINTIAVSQKPEIIMTPRQALTAEKVSVPVEKAAGHTAVQAICPCPPAIPVVLPGEKITAQAAGILAELGILNITVVK